MNILSVSVIIISHNSEGLFKCLLSVKKQTDENDEIIVVDDHSSIEFRERLTYFCRTNDINEVLSPTIEGNRAFNRNLGAKKAKNPILIFLDADIVLCDNSINSIKRAHSFRDEIAFIGTRYCVRYDPYRMFLVSGIENLPNIILESNNNEFLCDLPVFKDKRYTEDLYIPGKNEQNYYWIYYFSCCFSVLKNYFWNSGGFDSSFKDWGIEDIDLGYRLSLLGKLAFIENFKGIHVPHNRNFLRLEQENVRNLRCMLMKYQRFDIELTSIYRTTPAFLLEFKILLQRMSMLHVPELSIIDAEDNCLYINTISFNNPRGSVVFKRKNAEEKYELIGLSTWFPDKSIKKVIISSSVFLYPISVLCGILQEGIRVGKKVFIQGNIPKHRLDWSGFPNLTSLQPQKRNEYRAYDLMEFNFENMDKYIHVTSDIIEMNAKTHIPQIISIDNIKKIQQERNLLKKYCVLDFTNNSGRRTILTELKKGLNIDFIGIYSVDFSMNEDYKITIPNYLFNLFSIKTPLVIIVEKIKDFDSYNKFWQNRVHYNDIIIDYEGNIVVT